MLLESTLLNDEKFDNWWPEFGNLRLEIPQDFLVTLKCLWLVDFFDMRHFLWQFSLQKMVKFPHGFLLEILGKRTLS